MELEQLCQFMKDGGSPVAYLPGSGNMASDPTKTSEAATRIAASRSISFNRVIALCLGAWNNSSRYPGLHTTTAISHNRFHRGARALQLCTPQSKVKWRLAHPPRGSTAKRKATQRPHLTHRAAARLPHPAFLPYYGFTCALRTRVHTHPQRWRLCQMGEY